MVALDIVEQSVTTGDNYVILSYVRPPRQLWGEVMNAFSARDNPLYIVLAVVHHNDQVKSAARPGVQ